MDSDQLHLNRTHRELGYEVKGKWFNVHIQNKLL